MTNALHTCTLRVAAALLVAAALALTAAHTRAADKPDLANWRQADLYDGWRATELIDLPVLGTEGKTLGEVENILVREDGTISRIIVEIGGFLDIADLHVGVPWRQVELAGDMDHVRVPIREANVADFSLFPETSEVQTQPREWRATELIHDYVSLEDAGRYGLVSDLIFDRAGTLLAVLVQRAPVYGRPHGPYAYPYPRGYSGSTRGESPYTLPYTRSEIERLGPFDTGRLEPRGRGARVN
ncbi:MAG: PRC-barrel domain-containing protein [Burkholderiales bacterium]|nr:PRC-barrel domain-containing protein [Burkholderiales bacterium]